MQTGMAPIVAPHHGGARPGALGTRVNSPAFKLQLALCPPEERRTPAFDYTMKFEGQIILWLDEQVDLLTFTAKGVELADKRVANAGLNELVTSEKVSFEPVSRKLTYESLFTNRSRRLLDPVSLGLVADSSAPRPAFRFKCSSPAASAFPATPPPCSGSPKTSPSPSTSGRIHRPGRTTLRNEALPIQRFRTPISGSPIRGSRSLVTRTSPGAARTA